MVADLITANVDGRSSNHAYRLREVTGIDPNVQAEVANQIATVNIMLQVVRHIEEHNPQGVIFACHGATHRSVACCVLLSQAYPASTIRLTTPRTQRAARQAGMDRAP
jgi:RNase adaptor protein for sRNA GlmZ degradation